MTETSTTKMYTLMEPGALLGLLRRLASVLCCTCQHWTRPLRPQRSMLKVARDFCVVRWVMIMNDWFCSEILYFIVFWITLVSRHCSAQRANWERRFMCYKSVNVFLSVSRVVKTKFEFRVKRKWYCSLTDRTSVLMVCVLIDLKLYLASDFCIMLNWM